VDRGGIRQARRWADDERARLRGALDELRAQITEAERAIRSAGTEADKLAQRRRKHLLEGRREEAQRAYDIGSDGIRTRQGEMLDEIEASLNARYTRDDLFTCTWSVR